MLDKNKKIIRKVKKTRQGNSINTKSGNKGGGNGGSTTSKCYKKLKKGQG